MIETQHTVCAWTDDNFGPASSNFRVASRANEELAEAIRAVAADPLGQAAAVEAADTIIVLCRIAKSHGLLWGGFEVDPPSQHRPSFSTTRQYFTWANHWMARLLCELDASDEHDDAAESIQKIYVCLQHAIRRFDLEPADVISQKMVINRGRTWHVGGDGTGYHVRDKAEPPYTVARADKDIRLDAVASDPRLGTGKISLDDKVKSWTLGAKQGGIT